MRDFLSDNGGKDAGDPDPVRKAQELMKAPLPKRFYKEAATRSEEGGGWAVVLDGKPVRTPARKLLVVPATTIAETIAAEFAAQTQVVDPARMPMTRLANTALDGIAGNEQPVLEDIQRFAASDTLCYRAAEPKDLVDRQNELWDPVIDWARSALGARFNLAEGVVFVEQPRESIAAIGVHLSQMADPFRLAALHTVTTLTGSALLALALAKGFLDADAVWEAGHVDEDWNIAQWGDDAEAVVRRGKRLEEFRAAALVIESL